MDASRAELGQGSSVVASPREVTRWAAAVLHARPLAADSSQAVWPNRRAPTSGGLDGRGSAKKPTPEASLTMGRASKGAAGLR